MISFHLTELRNLPSILSLGLLGRRPRLPYHLEVFQQDGLEGDKVVYSWRDSLKTSKYAADMIFCKQWIDPRNVLSLKFDNFDFSKHRAKYLKADRYVLLKIDTGIDESNIFGDYQHGQTSSSDSTNALFEMDTRFEHDDKPLVMFKEGVKAEYIKPIELYDSEVLCNKLIVRNRPWQ